ncbi:hypothetical protein [Paenibacillus albilobatus]|uniref:hypothetical protein n=2 Tax=Paenibacillus TaxID=44249 RepID=UPI0013580AFA|nr:hypothetical protein [Paenibacillus albilobatus]
MGISRESGTTVSAKGSERKKASAAWLKPLLFNSLEPMNPYSPVPAGIACVTVAHVTIQAIDLLRHITGAADDHLCRIGQPAALGKCLRMMTGQKVPNASMPAALQPTAYS